jgi:hypothetical protein
MTRRGVPCDGCRGGGWLLTVGGRRLCTTCAPPEATDLFEPNPAPAAPAADRPPEPASPHDPFGEWA